MSDHQSPSSSEQAPVKEKRVKPWMGWTLLIAIIGVIAVTSLMPGSGPSGDTGILGEGGSDGARLAMFYGVQEVKADKLCELLPTQKAQAQVVHFTSKYCHDCQTLAPILESELEKHPEIAVTHLDIQYDRDTNASVFEAFKPTTVPVTIVVKPTCEIQHVLYGVPSAQEIGDSLTLAVE